MSTALTNETANQTQETSSKNEEIEELEAFYKLIVLEKDLLKLKDIISDVKKVQESCLVSAELKEMNVSRKK